MPGLPTTRAYADRIADRLRTYLAEAGVAGGVAVIEPTRTCFELAVGVERPNGDLVGLSRPAADFDNGAHGLAAPALNDVLRLLDPSVPEAPAPADRITYDDVMTLHPSAPAPDPAPQPPAPKAATRRKPARGETEEAPDTDGRDPDAGHEPAAD